MARSVQLSRELQRILLLPRRTWAESPEFARRLTEALRLPHGTQTLRPIQAQALYDLKWGGFFSIRVGGGKTLLSLLAPYVLGSRRPLLLLPAKLVEKTIREMRLLAQHWPIPNFIRIVSYELLGRAQSADLLQKYQPDLIVADEAHKIKNKRAAVTKRVAQYMAEKPATRFVAMSGTITKRSLLDYAHLVKWCLKPMSSPIPNTWHDIEEWADALDQKPENGTEPGALLLLATDEERLRPDKRHTARVAFRRRLVETPGVTATSERFLGSSLSISKAVVHIGRVAKEALHNLRTDWVLPDGQALADPLAVWRHARELALGFYYHWDPAPPEDWLQIRKDWASVCRGILNGNRRNLYSELQVTNAVDAGLYPQATPYLADWRAIRDTFEPNTVPVWLCSKALEFCEEWLLGDSGIVWCEHREFAKKLAKRTKYTYYGSGGTDERGRTIEQHPADMSLIASVASNAEGRNLQKWARNLITSMPPNGSLCEQLLARTHRDGQLAEEVTFDFIHSDECHSDALQKALTDARYIEASTGQAQKILYADLNF